MEQSIPAVSRLTSLKNSFRFYKNPLPFLMEGLEEFGNTYYSYLGGAERIIYTADPGLIQYILQKNQKNFGKSRLQTKVLSRFAGRGLLTVEGEYWKQQRRLIQPGFHKEKLSGLVEIMVSVIEKQLDQLEVNLTKEDRVDINKEMMEMAFQIVAHSLFSTNTQTENLEELSDNITAIQRFVIKQVRQPFNIPWYYLSGQFRDADRTAAATKSILLNFINTRRKQSGTFHDLLDMLLAARYEDTGEGMTDEQLVDESLIFFSAGHETSANALSWTWYLLAKHPEVVQKIRAETVRVLGDRAPEFADLRQLSYTMQVVQESLRLYPPAWIMDRIALEDDEYNGMKIPKGTMIFPFIYGAHRLPEFWENPTEFNPDRFDKKNGKDRTPFSFIPFGGGPRMCIGVNFAYMEMQLVIVQTLRRLTLDLVPGQEVVEQPLITLRPSNEMWVKRGV